MKMFKSSTLMICFSISWFTTLSASVTNAQGLSAPTVVRASGNIAPAVDECRRLLGEPLNGATAGEQAAGRREINWDGVPAGQTNTDTFPANFFNVNSKRGIIFLTPGSGFRVSDNNFTDINSSYADDFKAFSPQKTFMSVGSNSMDVLFQVSGASTAAAVKGFCVVFSDVDIAETARIELFRGNQSLGVFSAPTRSDADGASFVGAIYPTNIVTRVRITSGQGSLSSTNQDYSDGGALDLVVMDDFLYGEPKADSDSDGVLSAIDSYSPSDIRNKVDVDLGDNNKQTALDNFTLSNGQTIQDLLNSCIQQQYVSSSNQINNSRLRRCIIDNFFRLARARVLTNRAELRYFTDLLRAIPTRRR